MIQYIETMFKMKYLLWVVFCALILAGCKPKIKPSIFRIEKDLSTICKINPIPPKSEEKNHRKLVRNNSVVISRTYKTNLKYSEVKEHYKNILLKEGWKPIEGYEIFKLSDKTLIDFRKDEYLISLSYDNSKIPFAQKTFYLSCSWGVR